MAVTVMTTGVRDELGPRRRGLGHPRRPGREGKRGGDRCGCALQQGGSRGAASSCTNTTACMDRGCRRPGAEGACSLSTARAVAERSSDLIFTSLFTRHILAHNMYFNTYSFFFATFHHSNIYYSFVQICICIAKITHGALWNTIAMYNVHVGFLANIFFFFARGHIGAWQLARFKACKVG